MGTVKQQRHMSDSPRSKTSSLRAVLWAVIIQMAFYLVWTSGLISSVADSLDRRRQREFVFAHVKAMGGWEVFKRECDTLIAESRTNGQHQWSPRWGRALPASCKVISDLNPQEVQAVYWDGKPAYVTIKVFGLHATGGRDTPFYYLAYQQLSNSDTCIAPFHRGVAKKIADSVFEVY
jgi:hypothetical protein